MSFLSQLKKTKENLTEQLSDLDSAIDEFKLKQKQREDGSVEVKVVSAEELDIRQQTLSSLVESVDSKAEKLCELREILKCTLAEAGCYAIPSQEDLSCFASQTKLQSDDTDNTKDSN